MNFDIFFYWRLFNEMSLKISHHYITHFNGVERGYTGFTLSVCPSVCGWKHICSVPSIILAGSISYLRILSSKFRRCVPRKVLAIFFLYLWLWFCLFMTWDPIWINSMRRQGVFSERNVLVGLLVLMMALKPNRCQAMIKIIDDHIHWCTDTSSKFY